MSAPAEDLLARSALEQAALLRERRLSAEELVGFYLDRIERLNPEVQAFVSVFRRSARRDARACQRRLDRARGEELPAFFGVPIGIKDLNLVRFAFARMGSRAFRHLLSPVDDVTTRALRRGGFVLLGKLATSELGVLPVTEPDIHPPTRNPWDLEVTAGGSSGGSGAAVAGGLLPIAQGSDGAGSIRIPASFCHLYGFKCSTGLLPNPYRRVDPIGLAAVGPLAHTVDDAAAMLDVLAGAAGGRTLLEASRHPPGALRIRFVTRAPLGETDPEVAEVVMRVARALAEMGHTVEEGAPLDGSLEEFLPIWQRQTANAPLLRPSLLQPVTRWMVEEGRRHSAADVERLHRNLKARVAAWFGDADLWLTPTVPTLPPKIGAFNGLTPKETFAAAARLGPFTALFNLSGQPAASVPAGFARGRFPVGAQLVGRLGEDGQVLAVSRQIEQAMPWRHQRSPLAQR